MKIVKDPEKNLSDFNGAGKIEIAELKEMANAMFGDFVKAVVDIEKEIMAVQAELHADLMGSLIEKENSAPKNLWGINIFPEKSGEEFIVFDSMINLKPSLGNKTRGIDNIEIREKITAIVNNLVKK